MILQKENRNFNNLGGIKGFVLIPVSSVLIFGDIVKNKLLELVADASFVISPEIVQLSGSLSVDPISDNVYGYSSGFSISKDNASILTDLYEMQGKEFIVVIIDANNFTRVLGNLDNPVRISASFNKGVLVADLNSYKFSLDWQGIGRAPYLDLLSLGNNCFLLNGRWNDNLGWGDNCPWNDGVV